MTGRTAGSSGEPGVERVVSSETKFQGRICSVRVDTVELKDGRRATREIVEHEPVVVIVPITGDGDLIMVRQFRLATGKTLLELPAGIIDESDEKDIEAAAQRELQEEIGMRARELTPIGEFYASPGFLTEYMHIFLARGLEDSALDPDEDEDIIVERMPFAKAVTLVETGAIIDAKSVAGILLAARHL
ncbi:MAG TPA: NUDIX hydrolase [Dehalococcoidia bacterium]|nr:NUDIX hydrolase [Dehalococcoidia bacterium]